MINKNNVVIRISENVAETDFEDKIILLHIDNGEYYNFNETGSDLWRWLETAHSVDELSKKISQKYDCSIEDCLPDIIDWLNEVLDKNLVKVIS